MDQGYSKEIFGSRSGLFGRGYLEVVQDQGCLGWGIWKQPKIRDVREEGFGSSPRSGLLGRGDLKVVQDQGCFGGGI